MRLSRIIAQNCPPLLVVSDHGLVDLANLVKGAVGEFDSVMADRESPSGGAEPSSAAGRGGAISARFLRTVSSPGSFEMMSGTDRLKSERVMRAMLQMKKLDLPALRRAYEGNN